MFFQDYRLEFADVCRLTSDFRNEMRDIGFRKEGGEDSLFKAFPTRIFSRACFPSTSNRDAMLSIRSGRNVPGTLRSVFQTTFYLPYQCMQPAKSTTDPGVRC